MEVKIVKKVLDANDTMAQHNRNTFTQKGVFVLNVMSSPGSGKTTTLVKTLETLMPEVRCGVVVGDISTATDADRLATTGTPAVQITTDAFGSECHLSAHIVMKAAEELPLDEIDLLIVENIGNLVCPAEFDVGEDARIVILSVTEGEDKPLKYPLMFRECNAALINKTDLLPYLDIKIEDIRKNILSVHPGMPLFETSAKTGEGLDEWIGWLRNKMEEKKK